MRRRRPPRRPADGAGRRDHRRGRRGDRGRLRRHLGRRRWPRSPPTVAAARWPVTLLVNNAGGARGADPVETAGVADWQWMYDVNVLGTLRVTQALLPALEASGAGTIVMVSSTAGLDRLRGRRRLHRRQARPDRAGRDAAAGAVRPAGPGDRDRPRHGADRRVRADPLRRRRRARPRRSTPAWPSRWSPTTSPTASPGAPPGRTTSTWTGWWSGRWPRPPSTRCTGSPRR